MAVKKLVNSRADGAKEEYSGITTSAGAGSSGEIPALDSAGKLDSSMMPVGLGTDSITLTAGETLTSGNFVYINSSGQVMKADSTAIAKKAVGYVLVGVASASSCTVYFDDSNTALSALTVGATYYLSATAGAVTPTAPTTSGQIVQEVGVATSTSTIHVGIKEPVIRA